jgi:uncharacterized surface protein with fasciclin (FAS1) repeats
MEKKFGFLVALVAASLALSGCKKKNQEGQDPAAGKTAEGATAQGSSNGAPPPPAGSSAVDTAKVAPATKNLLETAKQAGSFTTFLKAIDAAGISDQLNGAGPFTVFAPTDDAFAKLAPKDLDALLADKPKLLALLQYHVATGNLSAKDLAAAKTEKSIDGPDLTIDAVNGLKISGATVVKPDLVASNGVIHGIDSVLTPPAK